MPVFGVWMWPQSVSSFGAQSAVERCVRAGITDIYFLAKGMAGTASWRSGIVPMGSERDLLGELLNDAHACGIRVHAWLTSASDEQYKNQHPESGRCHYTRRRDRGLISLTDEGYLAYMERTVQGCAGITRLTDCIWITFDITTCCTVGARKISPAMLRQVRISFTCRK